METMINNMETMILGFVSTIVVVCLIKMTNYLQHIKDNYIHVKAEIQLDEEDEYFEANKIIAELEVINKAIRFTSMPELHKKLHNKENELKKQLLEEIEKWD